MSVTIRGSGQVPVQIIQATTQTVTVTTSLSYVATTLTATITPSNSANRILVSCACPMQTATAQGGALSLYRGATKIFDPSALDNTSNFYLIYGVAGGYFNVPIIYLDAPSTTSPVTYTIYMSSYNGNSVRMPFSGGTTNANAVITLTELSYA